MQIHKRRSELATGRRNHRVLDAALSALIRLTSVKNRHVEDHDWLAPSVQGCSRRGDLTSVCRRSIDFFGRKALLTIAAVAKWRNRKITIDGSGAIANGIFLSLERDFTGSTTYSEIVQQLQKDEVDLFEILRVERERG